jgi:hypothetical protein
VTIGDLSLRTQENNEGQKWEHDMLERDCWRLIQTRNREDAEYLKSLECISNPEERQQLWEHYLREADQFEEECWSVIRSERQRQADKRKG